MTTICHVLDRTTGWQQRLGISHLLDRLGAGSHRQRIIALHRNASDALAPGSTSTEQAYSPVESNWVSAAILRRTLRQGPFDLIHAWGAEAAWAAVTATAGLIPLLVTLYHPALTNAQRKRLRLLTTRATAGFICPTGIVRRRLIEAGIAPESCVVVRPGVDFALINAVRRGDLRRRLGLPESALAIALPDPIPGGHCAREAILAVALREYLEPGPCVVIPAACTAARAIQRFASNMPHSYILVTAPADIRYEELLSVCDVLIVTTPGDVSTTAISWAMACGAGVVASAVPAVAELITHQVNGLLYKRRKGGNAATIAHLLEQQDLPSRCREVARGQAYEVFSIRRFAQQHEQAYANMIDRVPVGEGIVDPAMVG